MSKKETFKITKDTKFGTREISPDFEPLIKVTISEDLSAADRNKFERLHKKDQGKAVRWLIDAIVVDWNLVDEKDKKIKPTVENMDKYFSKRLMRWLEHEIIDFLGNKQED